MPWKQVSMMDQRREFVSLALCGGVSVSDLSRRFGISRDTAHRLLRRYAAAGEAGLCDRSQRPLASPSRTPAAMEERVLGLRAEHPAWGGRKIARRLRDLGAEGVPSASTITEILRRHGCLDEARTAAHRPFLRFEHAHPNALWQMDFKGHFATRSVRCHPLTVIDDHSRYALGLAACGEETEAMVRGHLTALFRRYGLPEAMLADNGPPWGSAGHPAPYTALGVWLLRLGVDLLHGRPRHPQTQGKDERFHRTLNIELLQGRSFRDLAECQSAFDTWRRVYNEDRPHESLGLDTPACRYRASPRSFPETLPEPQYHECDIVRRVNRDGYLVWKGRKFKMSQAFRGLDVAIRPTSLDGVYNVCFMSRVVANLDLRQSSNPPEPVRHVSEHLSDMSPV
jgi:transposase InsO family protein